MADGTTIVDAPRVQSTEAGTVQPTAPKVTGSQGIDAARTIVREGSTPHATLTELATASTQTELDTNAITQQQPETGEGKTEALPEYTIDKLDTASDIALHLIVTTSLNRNRADAAQQILQNRHPGSNFIIRSNITDEDRLQALSNVRPDAQTLALARTALQNQGLLDRDHQISIDDQTAAEKQIEEITHDATLSDEEKSQKISGLRLMIQLLSLFLQAVAKK